MIIFDFDTDLLMEKEVYKFFIASSISTIVLFLSLFLYIIPKAKEINTQKSAYDGLVTLVKELDDKKKFLLSIDTNFIANNEKLLNMSVVKTKNTYSG